MNTSQEAKIQAVTDQMIADAKVTRERRHRAMLAREASGVVDGDEAAQRAQYEAAYRR